MSEPMTQPAEAQAANSKPWYKNWKVWAVVIVLLIIISRCGGGDDADSDEAPASTQTTSVATEDASPEATEEASPEATEEASPEATEEPAAEGEAATQEEAAAVVRDYLAERAASGVRYAQTVTDVSVKDRVITVVFDFDSLDGVDGDLLRETNPFDNLAEFAGLELGWTTDESRRLRSAVDRVDTFDPAGNSLGSMTVGEIYEINTGLTYTPGD